MAMKYPHLTISCIEISSYHGNEFLSLSDAELIFSFELFTQRPDVKNKNKKYCIIIALPS